MGSSPTYDGMGSVLPHVEGLELEEEDDNNNYKSPGSSVFDEMVSSDDDELLPPPAPTPYEDSTDIFSSAFQQVLTDGVDSPNDMLVDTEDILADAENEKDDLAVINPDSESETQIRANDCRCTALGKRIDYKLIYLS